MEKRKFKVGDRVNIKPEYRGYRHYVENGIIVSIDNYEDVTVRWIGTRWAVPCYRQDWLEHADNALQRLKKRYGKVKA